MIPLTGRPRGSDERPRVEVIEDNRRLQAENISMREEIRRLIAVPAERSPERPQVSNSKTSIICYIFLDDDDTWLCSCKEHGAERTAAVAAGMETTQRRSGQNARREDSGSDRATSTTQTEVAVACKDAY